MSSLIDLSINATQIAVEYNEVDGGDEKLVEKLSKSQRIIKKSKKS